MAGRHCDFMGMLVMVLDCVNSSGSAGVTGPRHWLTPPSKLYAKQTLGYSLKYRLFLLPDALEGLAVLFDVHKLPALSIALNPLLGRGIEDLAPLADHALPVTVTGLSVFCHLSYSIAWSTSPRPPGHPVVAILSNVMAAGKGWPG